MKNFTYMSIIFVGIAFFVLVAQLSNGRSEPATVAALENVKTWMYQIQGLDSSSALQKLATSDYDLLVLEPTNTVKESERFDVAGMVAQMKRSRPDRLVLAYIDIGEAEDYRSYWKSSWRKPKGNKRGHPSFIVAEDPDDWSGNYPVNFWDRRWKKLMITGSNSALQNAIDAGFDGVYLDWVEAYDDETVMREAKKKKIDAAESMVGFIKKLRSHARKQDPGFLVVAQNAPYLVDTPGYLDQIDAAAFEDTWYSGEGDASWNSPNAGDIKQKRKGGDWSTASFLRTYGRYSRAGIPVFTVDYSLRKKTARSVYRASSKRGFKPLVTRVSLSRTTQTPPP